MKMTYIGEQSHPAVLAHANRVMGVAENHYVLEQIAASLEGLIERMEILEGNPGLGYLDHEEHSWRGFIEFFLGDQETEARHLYFHELEMGRIVFAVHMTPRNKADVVRILIAQGASHVMHFGRWVHENYGEPV